MMADKRAANQTRKELGLNMKDTKFVATDN